MKGSTGRAGTNLPPPSKAPDRPQRAAQLPHTSKCGDRLLWLPKHIANEVQETWGTGLCTASRKRSCQPGSGLLPTPGQLRSVFPQLIKQQRQPERKEGRKESKWTTNACKSPPGVNSVEEKVERKIKEETGRERTKEKNTAGEIEKCMPPARWELGTAHAADII